ncbi:hypothetical protein RM697_11660 [Ichthyenterobacterium sp. W332]|uniref:Uncharacterized protein n=1 Tax=Microcosmobacter mediterraneus TaxID=3075607 RepID=A0ABU2YMC2_9FLAO|nr:hypothetical protein [Ichthyenterobacterium sp. W332]MDT0559311.1 hypothetical protein [Ichthyenterobacterium sp. W332]
MILGKHIFVVLSFVLSLSLAQIPITHRHRLSDPIQAEWVLYNTDDISSFNIYKTHTKNDFYHKLLDFNTRIINYQILNSITLKKISFLFKFYKSDVNYKALQPLIISNKLWS